MDIINLRMWLFIIIGVLILGVVIGGIRRWRQYHNPYRLSINNGEPNIGDGEIDPLRHVFPHPPRPVAHDDVEFGDSDDLLSDTQSTPPQEVEEKPIAEPAPSAKPDSIFSRAKKPKETEVEKPAKPAKKKPKTEQLDLTTVPILIDPVDMTEHDDEIDENMGEEITEQSQETATQQEADEEIQEAIVINVFARDAQGFQGEPLLDVLLSCSLRYGDMSIFHRHQSPKGEGKVLFSVANAMNPGTFKIEAMNKFSTKGLSFFFGLPGPTKPIETFDLMLQTAQYLAKRLNGELKDDKRNGLTAQTIEHYRQRIRDFERRHLVQ